MVTISEYRQLTAAIGQGEVAKSSCIVLSELENPLLATADADSLAAVKTMVTGKQLLWVCKDDSPDTAMATGFAAAMRLEQPSLTFVTLAFGSLESPAHGALGVKATGSQNLWTALTADEGAEQPGWQHEPMFNHLDLQDGYSKASALGKQDRGSRVAGVDQQAGWC